MRREERGEGNVSGVERLELGREICFAIDSKGHIAWVWWEYFVEFTATVGVGETGCHAWSPKRPFYHIHPRGCSSTLCFTRNKRGAQTALDPHYPECRRLDQKAISF
jgi:hypothetical protein